MEVGGQLRVYTLKQHANSNFTATSHPFTWSSDIIQYVVYFILMLKEVRANHTIVDDYGPIVLKWDKAPDMKAAL
jgi:hypothetical protein